MLSAFLAIHGEGYCTVSQKVTRVNTHPFGRPGPRRVDMVEKTSQVSLLTQYCDRYSLYTLSLVLPAERQRKHYIITDHFHILNSYLAPRSFLVRKNPIVNHVLRWLNTVLRAVSGSACFKLDKQTWRRKRQWYTEDDFSKSTH